MASATAVPVSGSKLDNRRVLAALIDLLIVGAGYALILAAAGKLGAADSGGALTAVGVGWALYYYFACESGAGQTVGKRAMNIRVVRTDGAPAGMREIALRTILRLVDGLFVYLVGLIVMLATRERRGRLGDLVGGTMVVSADKPAPVVDMSAPEAPAAVSRPPAAVSRPPAAVSRVPIAESGPAFEPAVEPEAGEPEAEEPDVASPSLKELASDVTAVTQDPEREVEEDEPEVEELPAAEAEVEDEPVAEVEDEPVAEEEPEREEPESEDEVTVKSVETVSAIDLVMEEDKAPQS
jgi:uncharacterized RDD family membrane protein YckC